MLAYWDILQLTEGTLIELMNNKWVHAMIIITASYLAGMLALMVQYKTEAWSTCNLYR